ncbi:Putative transposase of IS4/5 family [Nonomuraea wenchangensis]|uniref:Putative transposase of IS4/5 family n=1 Tax=Nonomuraea wenchangensis TaxID=568860 RepID=A0A1I0KIY2_9ACTN|nr:Putative transposase of IS4/5 family [Nonomuraea wenchangensis]
MTGKSLPDRRRTTGGWAFDGLCSSRWFRQRRHDPKVAVDDRTIPTAIMYVATTGCAWQQLPPAFGASWHPMHRLFTEWSTSRVWAKLYRVLLTKLGARGELDWSRCALGSVSARAMKGGS